MIIKDIGLWRAVTIPPKRSGGITRHWAYGPNGERVGYFATFGDAQTEADRRNSGAPRPRQRSQWGEPPSMPACLTCGGPCRGQGRLFCSLRCMSDARRIDATNADLCDLIRLLYPHHRTAELADVLGMNTGTLRGYAYRLRLTKAPNYTSGEVLAPEVERAIRERWPTTSSADLGRELGIPSERLRWFAERLGVKKDREWLRARKLPVAPEDPDLREIRRLRIAINTTINRRAKELAHA